MQMSATCMICILSKQAQIIEPYDDEPRKAAYMQRLLKEMAEASPDMTAPEITRRFDEIHRETFGFGEDLTEQKRYYNQLALSIEAQLDARIEREEDPIRAALLYARAGNYIDFGVLNEVDPEKLTALLDGALEDALDEREYAAFRDELTRARRFTLLCDNAGEVVLDKLMLRAFQRACPSLKMTAIVRGSRTSNDATMQDALDVGLDRVARVIGNGTGLAGTVWDKINDETRHAIEEADLVLSKGQGNFETLYGCGLNVYYAFLNKCDWFTRRFEKPRLSGMFVNERNVHIGKYL